MYQSELPDRMCCLQCVACIVVCCWWRYKFAFATLYHTPLLHQQQSVDCQIVGSIGATAARRTVHLKECCQNGCWPDWSSLLYECRSICSSSDTSLFSEEWRLLQALNDFIDRKLQASPIKSLIVYPEGKHTCQFRCQLSPIVPRNA